MGSGQGNVCVCVCVHWQQQHTHKRRMSFYLLQYKSNSHEAAAKAVNANPWKDGKLTSNRTHWAIRMNYWCMLIFMQVIIGKVLIFSPNLQRKVLPSLSPAQCLYFNQRQTAKQRWVSMYWINSSGSFPGSALWEDIFSVLPHYLTFLLSDKGYSMIGWPTSVFWLVNFCPRGHVEARV